jgi:hypothetical protein
MRFGSKRKGSLTPFSHFLWSFEDPHPSRINGEPERANGNESNAEPEERIAK